jgi:hypothetical protein
MAAGPVQLGDDVSDGIADPWNLAQPAFRDDALERLGERRQALRGTQISLGTIGIAACECRPAAIFRSFASPNASSEAIGSSSEVSKRDGVSKVGHRRNAVLPFTTHFALEKISRSRLQLDRGALPARSCFFAQAEGAR